MAVAIKQLANGQLPAAIGDLYTAPASTTTLVKKITLVNTDTSARTANLYVLKSGGTARRIIPKDISLGVSYKLEEENITLEAGDKIRGDASAANVVDYVLNGIEET